MKPFDYDRPASLAQALAALAQDSRPLAGGTDLLTLMKADLEAPRRLVDVMALLPRAIEHGAGGAGIGAAATLADLELDAGVRSRYAALAEAAALAASPQLRNAATIGGNLLQRPRCWYFRNARIDCWLKGAERCPAREGENRAHALFGGGPCCAVHPSDPAAALLAFDAEARLAGRSGERWLALERLFALPQPARRSETVLGAQELLLELRLPAPPAGTRSTYLKAMDRKAWSFALAGVAAALAVSGGRITHARVVLSGVAPVPWRARAAERALAGAPAAEASFESAAAAALQDAVPLRHNGYKMTLVRALVRRALQELAH